MTDPKTESLPTAEQLADQLYTAIHSKSVPPFTKVDRRGVRHSVTIWPHLSEEERARWVAGVIEVIPATQLPADPQE